MLYDAVVVLCSVDGAAALGAHPAAKDFVTDAHAHCKVIGYSPPATALFDAAGLIRLVDAGYVELSSRTSPTGLLDSCRGGRIWARDKTA